jgi:hypothetical protein
MLSGRIYVAQTFLQLSPEHGGTRFGPFEGGMIVIGFDGQRCQVVLPRAPGFAPVHAMITPQADGTYRVQPAMMGAVVSLVQGGSLVPVQGAVPARSGDAVVIGANGPRFTLEGSAPVQNVRSGLSAGISGVTSGMPGKRNGGYGNLWMREIEHMMNSRLMRWGPFREFSNISYRLRSGSLFHPRVLIPTLMGLGGVIVVGIASCAGVVGALLGLR